MCNAFSCLVDRSGKVYWEFAVDSHSDLVDKFKFKDDTINPDRMKFARAEISPKNGDYLKPDEWEFKVDERIEPSWLNERHERACWSAWKKWKKQLDEIMLVKEIIHPFEIKPPKKITKEHIELLKKWDSVWDSVEGSVRGSVWDSVEGSVEGSVGGSVGGSVWDSVKDSMWDSVRGSVWDSMSAYIGTFFKLKQWKYVKHKMGAYPFQPVVDLLMQGLVASFDGKTWRLHGGKEAKIMFEISRKDLKKWKG